jgi:hypothetical protein
LENAFLFFLPGVLAIASSISLIFATQRAHSRGATAARPRFALFLHLASLSWLVVVFGFLMVRVAQDPYAGAFPYPLGLLLGIAAIYLSIKRWRDTKLPDIKGEPAKPRKTLDEPDQSVVTGRDLPVSTREYSGEKEMKNCVKCGLELRMDTVYCPKCGAEQWYFG